MNHRPLRVRNLHPLYLAHERHGYSVVETARSKKSLLGDMWSFFFGGGGGGGNTASALSSATSGLEVPAPLTNGCAFDLTAGWLDTALMAQPTTNDDVEQRVPLVPAVDARVDDASASEACPALGQIISLLQLEQQSDKELREDCGLPADILVLDARQATLQEGHQCRFLAVMEPALESEKPFNVLSLDTMEEKPMIAADHAQLLVTRDPRPMLKAVRQQLFGASSENAFAVYESINGNHQPIVSLLDVEALNDGQQRSIRFVLSNGDRVGAQHIAGKAMRAVNLEEAPRKPIGSYFYVFTEGDRRHSGVLFIGIRGWRFLTRNGRSWLSKRYLWDDAKSSALYRMGLTAINLAQAKQFVESVMVGVRVLVKRVLPLKDTYTDIRGIPILNDRTLSIAVSANFDEVEVINHEAPNIDLWQIGTEQRILSANGIVSSQKDLDDVLAVVNSEKTPGEHLERVRTALVGCFVYPSKFKSQYVRIADVRRGQEKTVAVTHAGIDFDLIEQGEIRGLVWVPFPIDDANTDSKSSIRGNYYMQALAGKESAAYAVLGWPSNAPPLFRRRDDLQHDAWVLSDGASEGVTFAVPVWDLVRLSAQGALKPILDDTSVANFYASTRWNTVGRDGLQLWTSPDSDDKRYLVETKTKAVLAVQYLPSPPTAAFGFWASADPLKTSNDIPAEFAVAMRLAVYSPHCGLPGTAYTGDWSDYSSSAGAMPPLTVVTAPHHRRHRRHRRCRYLTRYNESTSRS